MDNFTKNPNTLPIRDVYKLMHNLIKEYYFETYSDDIGSLAGSMKLATDENRTLDPAIWHDWLEVICGSRIPDLTQRKLTLEEGYNAAITFFTLYANQLESKDLRTFTDQLTFEKWLNISMRNLE